MSIATNSYYEALLLSSTDTSAAITTDTDKTALTSEDFLSLLVTELQYQDPTEPMDNTEMVNQLTQYSQLDELAAMNEKLDALTESMNAMTNTNGLDYLGKEVEAAGYDISKSGDDVTELYFELDEYAESLVCNIYDNNGAIVDSVNFTQVDAGKHSFTWDGTDFNGNTQDDGTYIALMSATNSDGDTSDVSTSTTGTVTGINNTDEGVVFTLDDGRTVNMLDVTYVTT